MRNKKKKAGLLVGLVLAVLCSVPAFAASGELPVKLPTKTEASVSGKLDMSSNKDPKIGTQFYMYIEPDPIVKNIPKMGDSEIDSTMLLSAAFVTGTLYLGVSTYADRKEKE